MSCLKESVLFLHGFLFKTTIWSCAILDNFIFLIWERHTYLGNAWIIFTSQSSLCIFYKYPWKHIQHKRILDSQCLILGKYCRNIYFFSFWMQGIFWAMVSVLSFATNFCLKFASGRFCMWIHSQTCTLADFHVQTKLSSFPFQSVPWKHKALSV